MPGSRSKDFALALALLFAACGDRPSRSADQANAHWVSEPEFRFGDALAGDALFGFIPSMRVSPDGRRVYVLEPDEARVSVRTPDGRRLLDVGGSGEGPGDFMLPYRIHLGDSWFYVRDQSRFTYFYNDGRVLRTVPNPPTSASYQGFPIRVDAHFADGSFLGFPTIPASVEMGVWGDDPITTLPLLWLRETSSGWRHDPLFWQNTRNETLLVAEDGYHFSAQPYADSDIYWEDPGAGSVVVARRAGEDLGPGQTELIEVIAPGDTVWERRMEFDPVRLTRPMVDAAIDDWRSVVDESRRPSREAVEDALHLPEYLPAVRTFHLTSSGHVRIRSHERRDTLSVWYSLVRGDDESPPRRVLLPEGFQLFDATETHVWGVWKDELGINYVCGAAVGARLVTDRGRGTSTRTWRRMEKEREQFGFALRRIRQRSPDESGCEVTL